MPCGDRTGPYGAGPKSGRGLGFCNGYNMPGYVNNWRGGFHLARAFGYGGRGLRWRNNASYNNTYSTGSNYSKEDECSFLKNELNLLKEQIKNYEKRIEELNRED